MVLGKLSVPRRSTNLDNSKARAYCACSRCGWGRLDIFLLSIFSPFFFALQERARYRLKYCLKGPLRPNKQPNKFQLLIFIRQIFFSLICYLKSRFFKVKVVICGKYNNLN